MFFSYELAKEIQRERLREMEKNLLIRQAIRNRPPRPFLSWLSAWMRDNLLLKLSRKLHRPAARDHASNNLPV